MSINLTNRNDIECDSLTIINNNGRMNVHTSITNLNKTVNSVTGIPIETLNSIQKIGEAIDNDPQFFTNINGKIDNKQNKFLIADASVLPANTSRLFDVNNTKFRAINVSAPLSITTPNYEYVTINCDSYDKANIDAKLTTINTNITNKQDTIGNGTGSGALSQYLLNAGKIKNLVPGSNGAITMTANTGSVFINGIDSYNKSEIDTKFSNLIGSAPAVLNTLQEIASVIGDSSSITTSLINAIALKANSLETFYKSSIDSDIYLGIGNKRIVSFGTINNKLIFEICDSIGGVQSDNYYSALSLEMNTVTKKITCTIPDILIVNGINILTELANKLNSSSLSSYVLTTDLTSTLSSYLKLNVNNRLFVPNIILTTTTTSTPTLGSRSPGSRLVLFDLQSTNGSTTLDYAIGVEPSHMWFSIDGANASLTGGYKFYCGNNNVVAKIKGNGDFECSNITSSGLTIGTTNILTTLNNKLNISDATQSLTCNIFTCKQLLISDSKPTGQNVSATITNSGIGGYASIYVRTLLSNGQPDEVMQFFTGSNYGGNIVTRSQSDLKFSTFIDDGLGSVLPSIQISSSPLREFIVNQVPFIVRSDLSTFQNSVYIGSEITDLNDETLTVKGCMRINGLIRAEGPIQTGQIKVIGGELNSGVEIQNKDGSMVAKFANNFKTILNGNTDILGDFYCSQVVDCYRHTAKEIRARDATGLEIQNNIGTPIIKLLSDNAVEVCDDLAIVATRNDGSRITSMVENLGTGYACNILKAPYEEGEIWIGNGYGLNLRTNTEGTSISFQTGSYSSPVSMSILGSGDRSVEVFTNLNAHSPAVFDNIVTVGATMSTASIGLQVNNTALINGNLTVVNNTILSGTTTITGALTTTSFYAPKFYMAGRLSSGVFTNIGGFLTNATVAISPVGTYTFTMPTAHPSGTNYMVIVSQQSNLSTTASAVYGAWPVSSTSFIVYSKTTAGTLAASSFFVHTIP